MAKEKLQTMLLEIINPYGFISPGVFYRDSQIKGYKGSQEKLLETANQMVEEGILEGRRRGRAQKVWYKIKEVA